MRKKAAATAPTSRVQISAPNFRRVSMDIVGTRMYVSNNFGAKAISDMERKQSDPTSHSKRTRVAKNFEEKYEQSMHKSKEGWYGIPVTALRGAMVSACRLINLKMTLAKLTVDVIPDGVDPESDTPLVKIIGKPRHGKHFVRLATGVADIASRGVWPEWKSRVTVQYDADIVSAGDVVNLVQRAGQQVGIGAGRPDSKTSVGMGWGLFKVDPKNIVDAAAAL